MRTTLACLALALLASACIIEDDGGEDGGGGDGSGSGSGSGSGGGGGGGGGGGSVTPHAGRWFYDEVTPVSSNCPGIINEAQGGEFRIEQATAAGFRVIPEDGTAAFDCTLAGKAFSCPDRVSDTRDYRTSGVDAVVTIHADAHGTFSSENRASGRQAATVSCTGSQCAAYGGSALPCHFTVDFVVQAF